MFQGSSVWSTWGIAFRARWAYGLGKMVLESSGGGPCLLRQVCGFGQVSVRGVFAQTGVRFWPGQGGWAVFAATADWFQAGQGVERVCGPSC